MHREDHESFALFHLDCVALEEEHPDIREAHEATETGFDARKELAEAGVRWDRALFESLFVPPIEHTKVEPDFDDEPAFGRKTRHATAHLTVDDAAVRYHDDMDTILVVIDGELDAETTRILLDDLCDKLARLHGVACTAKRIE